MIFYLIDDLIGELDPKKTSNGYLLKTFSVDDVPCVSFDYISQEAYDELFNNLSGYNVSTKAFDGCGAEEVFRRADTKNIFKIYDYSNIIDKIIENSEVAKFIDDIEKFGYNLEGLYDRMAEDFIFDGDDFITQWYDDAYEIFSDKNKSIKERCQFYDDYLGRAAAWFGVDVSDYIGVRENRVIKTMVNEILNGTAVRNVLLEWDDGLIPYTTLCNIIKDSFDGDVLSSEFDWLDKGTLRIKSDVPVDVHELNNAIFDQARYITTLKLLRNNGKVQLFKRIGPLYR